MNAGAGKAAGKTCKRGPEHTALGGMGDWDRHGQVRASEITLSGAGRCSGRGRVWAGSHSDVIVHAGRCIAVPQLEPPRTGSHECIDPQQGCPLQWEGTRTCGHVQRCELRTQPCAGGACLSAVSMKNRLRDREKFPALHPDYRPVSCCKLFTRRMCSFLKIVIRGRQKFSRKGTPPAQAACLHARPLPLQQTAPLRVNARRCAIPPARVPSRCSDRPR